MTKKKELTVGLFFKKLQEKGIERSVYLVIFGLRIIGNIMYGEDSLIIPIVLFLMVIVAGFYRCINLGRSAWYGIGIFVPFYNIYLLVLMSFFKKSEVATQKKPTLIIVLGMIPLVTILAIMLTVAYIGL